MSLHDDLRVEELVGDAEREDFIRNGFFTRKCIASPEEVALIRSELLGLLSRKAGFKQGALTDLVAPGGEPSVSPQMLNPSNFSAALRRTEHRANCFAIARAILGPDARLAFEHMIYKPPGIGAGTHWHQDDAFTADADAECAQISIWMPLHDVDESNSCMRYIARSHLGPLLPHHSPNNDVTVSGLELDMPEDAPAPTYVPLSAGDCVVHHSRTMHGAGPNHSSKERLAYVLAFDGPPRRREGPVTFPWLSVKQMPRIARHKHWLLKGGLLFEAWRKIRDGRFNDPRRVSYKAGKVWRRMKASLARRFGGPIS